MLDNGKEAAGRTDMPACGLRHRVKIVELDPEHGCRYKCCDVRDCPFKVIHKEQLFCQFNQEHW
jgi:hypothetical protein